jgi:1,4-alpha-glucan branching enzyme
VSASGRAPGALALVLHTHMPYVEGFGTWPFGEEWLWEAVATSYLPLLNVLGAAPLTVSLTPVLCDQLEAPGALERCRRFLQEVRPDSHARDIAHFAQRGETHLVAELERSAAEYAAAAERLTELGEGLLAELGRHAAWTSAATHPVLPLLASDGGIELQLRTGVASHRRRFGHWGGGLWLPECAYAPWLDGPLVEAGVHAGCVELTRLFGAGDPRHLRPLRSEDGPLLWPVDRLIMDLVWSQGGYPSRAAYRDYHHHTPHRHRPWSTDGGAYDADRARHQAREDAADFVARARERVRAGGVCVCALDTELLGHWWYEGPWWLDSVLDEAARQGLALTSLDAAPEYVEPAPAPAQLPVSSWGDGGDLRTWSSPHVAEVAWQARRAELRVAAAGARAPERALRELLALQSSDWAFLVTRDLAGPYPLERARRHEALLHQALAGEPLPAQLRHLAPDLVRWPA